MAKKRYTAEEIDPPPSPEPVGPDILMSPNGAGGLNTWVGAGNGVYRQNQ